MRVPSLVSPSFSPASSFASTLSSYSPTIDTYHLAGYTPQGWIHSSTGDLLTTTHCLHHLSADDCGPLTPSHNDSPDATSEINACSNGIFATYTNNIKTECHSPLPVPEPPPLGVAREDSIPQQLSTLSQSSPVTALIEPYAGISPLPSPSASSEVDSEYHPARTLRPRRAPAARSLPQSHHSALSHAPTRKSPLRAGEKRKGQNRQAQWKYREKKKHVHKLVCHICCHEPELTFQNSTLIASMIAEVNKFGESDKTTKRQTETLARLVKLTAKYCEEVEGEEIYGCAQLLETCPKICGELTANVAAALGQ